MSNCTCKPGMERDNCPACEGTGKRIDFSSFHICPKCGKRGDGITYEHKEHGCDDNYIDTDRKLMMPDSRFRAWQEANKSEPMGAFDTAWQLLKAERVTQRDTNGQAVFYAANMNKGQDQWYYYASGNKVYRRRRDEP